MNRPLAQDPDPEAVWFVLDTETTGFPAHRPGCPIRALSVGVAVVPLIEGRREIRERWTALLCPPVWPSPAVYAQAEAVHGLSRERIEREGLQPRDGWIALAGYLGAQVQAYGAKRASYLAWNSDFDWQILRRLASDAGLKAPLDFPDVPLAPDRVAPRGCLMRAWKAQPAVKTMSGSLDKARASLNLAARVGHHDAGDDAMFAAEVLIAWLRRGPLA